MTIYSDLQTVIDARLTAHIGGHADTDFCDAISKMSLTYSELVDLVGDLLIRIYALENP